MLDSKGKPYNRQGEEKPQQKVASDNHNPEEEEPNDIEEPAGHREIGLSSLEFVTEWEQRKPSNLEELPAKGSPTIVTIRLTAATKYSRATSQPPNTTQMIFPRIFIALLMSGCGGLSTKHRATTPRIPGRATH